ncbi:MAG: hypothetical protein JW788_01375 [Candidatus Omnitrophica bacterium]|nr:hypothetical protein [Candidatus Omnitrophota bacterium]
MRYLPVKKAKNKRQKAKSHFKIKNLEFLITLLAFNFLLLTYSYAAPCYGTKMPKQRHFFTGLENYSIFKNYLENDEGKVRSTQNFLRLSYGAYDWLSIDLKGGAGNIKQHPFLSDEVDYVSNFAGGYGFRLKLYDRENIRAVFGFQHISVHPRSLHLGEIKHQAVLDDWQLSFLISDEVMKLTPYLGTKYYRIDYIHWATGKRKRIMSDLTKVLGLVAGVDIELAEKIWLNLEGQFIDNEAIALSLNCSF